MKKENRNALLGLCAVIAAIAIVAFVGYVYAVGKALSSPVVYSEAIKGCVKMIVTPAPAPPHN